MDIKVAPNDNLQDAINYWCENNTYDIQITDNPGVINIIGGYHDGLNNTIWGDTSNINTVINIVGS